DLYFRDPHPGPGQEGSETGVRMELRFLELQPEGGSIYASRPILVGQPLWRVDLLESVDSPGSLDRAHHHPKMKGWEPGFRRFEAELSGDPVGWVGRQLDHLEDLVEDPAVSDGSLDADFEQIRRSSTEILEAVRRMLDGVGRGELGRAPDTAADTTEATLIRSGWL
ncbi:MAG: hypothetical protein ACRDV4_09530, partial [Acidimicrobiales bacterium]